MKCFFCSSQTTADEIKTIKFEKHELNAQISIQLSKEE